MVARWCWCSLLAVCSLAWAGCSSESDQASNPRPAASAGHAGTGGSAGSGASGGTTAEGGAAGSESVGGSGARGGAVARGGSGTAAGRGGAGGMFGMGAFAGTSADIGGTAGGGGSAGRGGSAGSVGTAGVPNAWACIPTRFGDGVCDCGCGVPDSDCKDGALSACEVCNGSGSCNRAKCPGNIDPDDVTRCTPPPDGWTCTPSTYNDGTTCDCGCGIRDTDCPNGKVESCDDCQAVGACSNGVCPSSIAPKDNATCEVPPLWWCDKSFFGDGTCDCGCGVVDADCSDAGSSRCARYPSTGCANNGGVEPDDNAHCTNPPYAWRCPESAYLDTVCDCGCGAPDPACTSFELDACDRCDSTDSCSAQPCPGLIRSDLTWSCSKPAPPAGWTCVDGAYGDTQYCNCGCGVQDPDCRTTDPAECEICRCGGTSCADTLDPDDSTQCKPPPVDWICSEAAYRDYYCSCGCEAPDPACNGENGSGACSDFPVEGCSGGNASHIAANRNAFCSISPPNEWTCSPAYYQDDLCDCGCGALDPDCTSAKASTCEKCNDEGSCSADDCPGSILANDNAHCSN